MIEAKLCYDGGTCRNEVAVAALRQYAEGKTWRHIATDALKELEERGLLKELDMAGRAGA